MVRTVSLTDYVTLERPSLNWLIPELLPKPGMLLLTGEPFAGKSFLAFQLGLMLAQGGLFLHRKCRQSRVLYLQFDPSELVWRDRILSIQKAGISLAGPLFMVHPDDNRRNMHILTVEHQRFLQECLTASEPDVVIRVLDCSYALNLNLEGAVLAKMDKNEQRAYKHGGKLA